MLQRKVETSSSPENQHAKRARNKSFSCSFGVGPRWQGPVSEMVMTGALARYDRPRLWRLHGDGQILDRMGKPVRILKIRKNKTCKSGSKKSIYLRRKIVGFQIAMLVIAKPGFEEAGPFSSSAAGLTFVGLPAEWLNFQPFLEQSCSLIYLWWSRGTANTSGTVLPILACCQGFLGFICLSWHPQNGWRLRPKMRQKPSISMNMLIC